MSEENKNKKKETKTTNDTSVELMKRELELFDRKKEFEKLVSEIKSELAEVQEKISSKGWTAKEDGSWVIEWTLFLLNFGTYFYIYC